MRKKLLITYTLLIAVTVLVTVAFSWKQTQNYFFEQVESETQSRTALLRDILVLKDQESTIDFQDFATEYGSDTERITIIDESGVVLADSMHDPSTMENHQYRQEVRSALQGLAAYDIRYSSTMGYYYYYYAIPLVIDDDIYGVLRVAVPVDDIQALVMDMVQSVGIGLLLGFLLSLIVAYVFARKFMQPIDELTQTAKVISEGDYDNKVYIDNQDQIGELAEAFNTMTFTMRKNLWEIEQKNAELESILTSIDFGLAAIDESYRIILNNNPFKSIMGLSGELDGHLFYEVTRNTSVFKVIEESIENDEFIEEETVLETETGQRILRFSANPIKSRTSQNRLHGILLIVEDVTKLRKLERVRQEFVSNVTHELKTPLTSIKGFVETLKNGAIEDEKVAIRFLDIIEIESDRLSNLIGDILSLSSIENMSSEENLELVSMEALIDEVTLLLKAKAEEKKLKIHKEISSDLPLYSCNRDRMKQLMINLLDNAIKYTEKGQVTIKCRRSRNQQIMELTVQDTGIGIDKEHLERLFERFYRVDKGRSRDMGGTGLGLSIVKHIVELYNGTVDVVSKPEEGSTFKIRLPYNY